MKLCRNAITPIARLSNARSNLIKFLTYHVTVTSERHLVIKKADYVRGLQMLSPAYPAHVNFKLYTGIPAGGIQKYFNHYFLNNRALSLIKRIGET